MWIKKRLRDIKAQCAEENGPCSLGPQLLISPSHGQSLLASVLPSIGILYIYT